MTGLRLFLFWLLLFPTSPLARATPLLPMVSPSVEIPDAAPTTVQGPLKDPFKTARLALLDGHQDQALQAFNAVATSTSDPETKSLAYLGLGLTQTRLGQDKDAQVSLEQATQFKGHLDDYIHYFLGDSYARATDLEKAEKEFNLVLKSPQATPQKVYEARFELGQIAMKQKKWWAANSQFRLLQKKWKNTERYADVIWQMLLVERQSASNPVGRGCRWARELYAKYPAYPQLKDWGFDLQSSLIDGKRVGCSASVKDQQTRMKRFELAGEFERALKELTDLKAQIPGQDHYSVDSMIANHLISDGRVEEALKILTPYSEEQGQRPGYLLLLAKANSRAGRSQLAVAEYEKAYSVAPRSKSARNALFQAAFVSYQFQDYEKAAQTFETFVHKFPTSNLSGDAKWHLAWIHYLQGKYDLALSAFQQMAKHLPSVRVSHRHRRGGATPVDNNSAERARYWVAMSLYRLGRISEARLLFQALAKDASIGYYSVSSYYRLASLPEDKKASPNVKIDSALLASSPAAVNPEDESDSTDDSDDVASDDAEDSSEVAQDSGAPDSEGPLAEREFNNINLSQRFERARGLAMIGLNDQAREELAEIERRTRKPSDLRALMNEYQVVQSYFRSSYLGELTFGNQRVRAGVQDGKILWEFAYPRAFEKTVLASSKLFSVPEELIWGIMRAESHYREDARSPVGAMGLMQLMPYTSLKVADQLLNIKNFDVHESLLAETNIRLGSRYLKRLSDSFEGKIPLIAAGYNAGPHRVSAWLKSFGKLDMDEFIEHIPYIETRNYVKKVVRNCQIYQILYAGGAHNMAWLSKPIALKTDLALLPTKEIW
jgi:soluble lytic murein transglycosylase